MSYNGIQGYDPNNMMASLASGHVPGMAEEGSYNPLNPTGGISAGLNLLMYAPSAMMMAMLFKGGLGGGASTAAAGGTGAAAAGAGMLAKFGPWAAIAGGAYLTYKGYEDGNKTLATVGGAVAGGGVGFMAATPIAAGVGALLGTAICPVLGTAIGIGLGALVGAGVGWLFGKAGANNQEKAVAAQQQKMQEAQMKQEEAAAQQKVHSTLAMLYGNASGGFSNPFSGGGFPSLHGSGFSIPAFA